MNPSTESFSPLVDEKKKRRFLWMIVILTNIAFLVAAFALYIIDETDSGKRLTFGLLTRIITHPEVLIMWVSVLIWALIATAVPVWIALSKSLKKKWYVQGIITLLSGITLYWVQYIYTCEGKWCEFDGYIFGSVFGILTLVFGLFYLFVTYAMKKPERLFEKVFWSELVLVAMSLFALILMILSQA